MDFNNFDATQEKPLNNFEALPNGWYTATIVASEEKPTSKGDGSYLNLTFEILEGDYKGRKVWDRLNLNNRNAQAVEIARGTLAAICLAVGVPTPKASHELHNLAIRIKVTQREYNGSTQNEIKAYEAAGGKQQKPRGGKQANTSNGNGRAKWLDRKNQPKDEREPATVGGDDGYEEDEDGE